MTHSQSRINAGVSKHNQLSKTSDISVYGMERFIYSKRIRIDRGM